MLAAARNERSTTFRGAALVTLCLAVTLATGCDRGPAADPGTKPARTTVASISPAATDLIVGMGAKDRLVGVSHFDRTRAETRDLPGVGDYRTIDWERIAELRPSLLIVQYRADKMPTGLTERAASYGIRVINVEINRLDHIYATLDRLGTEIGEPDKARAAADRLRAQLAAVAARVAGKPTVRTLISRTDNPLEAVGGGNFLDDLLTIAGGRNVLSGPGYDDNSYPTLDRELLLSLNPDAVLNLLPAASPQVIAKARDFWTTMPVAAQKAGRVHYLTEEYLLWPGLSAGNIAERFATALHGEHATDADPKGQRALVTSEMFRPLLRYAGGGSGRGFGRIASVVPNPGDEAWLHTESVVVTSSRRFVVGQGCACIRQCRLKAAPQSRPTLRSAKSRAIAEASTTRHNPLPNPPPAYRRRGTPRDPAAWGAG